MYKNSSENSRKIKENKKHANNILYSQFRNVK